jgi:predicted nucleic acid-binding protein
MILIDTSAWIEFLRDTQSPVCSRVDELLASDIATCDPVRMEVLAGARDEANLGDLRRLLARATTLPTLTRHYDDAASIYRRARAQGFTIRRLNNCLIAAIALDSGAALLHADRDFDVIAQVTGLGIEV